MFKLKNLKKDKFDTFVCNNEYKSHFLQSLSWGEFSKAKKNLIPHYLGLVNEKDEIVAATLLLQKKLPLKLSYFYAPRGFVMNYKDSHIVKEMTKAIVKFAKEKKGIFVKIDPDLIKTSFNYLNEEKESEDWKKIFDCLISNGWRHQGFTKNFETTQPRYSFRIDLEQSLDDIEKHFSKTTKQRISKSLKLATQVEIGDKKDIKKFYHLMTLTENRKNFVSYTEDYYESLFDIFNSNKNSKAVLFLGKIYFSKTIDALEKNLNEIENQKSLLSGDNLSKSAKTKLKELTKQGENINKEIAKFLDYKGKYGDYLTLSAHLIIIYGDKAWVLYAGNHNLLSETYANYNTYFEHIKYSKNNNLKIYDQFGTIGDLSKDNPRLGLHEFKKKFGGNYVEFIGEFDYVINKTMYFVFTKLVPFYRNFMKKKSKRILLSNLNKD